MSRKIIEQFSVIPALSLDPKWQPVFQSKRPTIADSVRNATYRAIIELLLAEGPGRFLVIKGPVLAHLVYPEPLLRPCGDLDVLVEFSEIPSWIKYLESNNYVWHEGALRPLAMNQTSFTHTSGAKIDLHWALALPTIPSPAFGETWASRQVVKLGATSVPTLGPMHGALHLALHFHQHVGSPRILLDFALWIDHFSIEPEALLRDSEAFGLRRVTKIALRILDLLGVSDIAWSDGFTEALAELILESWMKGETYEGDDLSSYAFHTLALLLLNGGHARRLAQHFLLGPHRFGSQLGRVGVFALPRNH